MQLSGGASAQIAIDSRSVHAVVQLPVEAMDLLLRIDRDLDGTVTAAELTAARGRVAAYVSSRVHVKADGAPLPLSIGAVTLSPDPAGAARIEAVGDARARSRISTIAIDSALLTDVSSAGATSAEIRIGDRTETFVFQPGAVFERRLSPDRLSAALLVAAAVAVLGVLWLVRRRRTTALLVTALLAAGPAAADVIMSAPALNATLKTMERLQRQADGDSLFRVGAEADALADLINLEVESHGMQERALIDLALSRTKDLGIAIAYNREKKKFFYDGAAFVAYLSSQPHGSHAAEAAFKLLSYEFYQLMPADTAALTAAAAATKRFLAQYPSFEANAEVRLYLAVDYRDLHVRAVERRDSGNAAKYKALAAAECQRIIRTYPHAEQAGAARQLLNGLHQ